MKIINYANVKHFVIYAVAFIAFNLLGVFPVSSNEEVTQSNNQQVIQAFTSQQAGESDLVKIEDQEKRLVMFLLGVPLLLFILATGALGLAMGVYGKDVFVAHMVCAGFSMTLALAHAVVGVVWFYPF